MLCVIVIPVGAPDAPSAAGCRVSHPAAVAQSRYRWRRPSRRSEANLFDHNFDLAGIDVERPGEPSFRLRMVRGWNSSPAPAVTEVGGIAGCPSPDWGKVQRKPSDRRMRHADARADVIHRIVTILKYSDTQMPRPSAILWPAFFRVRCMLG